jgi:hypothetical protein
MKLAQKNFSNKRNIWRATAKKPGLNGPCREMFGALTNTPTRLESNTPIDMPPLGAQMLDTRNSSQ